MAARAMAAAVLRPTGSARMCWRAGAGKCLRTEAACSTLVTVQMWSARNERAQASDGLLQHGVRADDIQELLGRAGAAAGPEAGAAASGENYGVSGEFVGGHDGVRRTELSRLLRSKCRCG